LTLYSFIKNQALEGKINLIKIDVEGFKIPLLSGSAHLLYLNNAPDMIVEFTESNAKNANLTFAELYNNSPQRTSR
jgi:hypothetical protein